LPHERKALVPLRHEAKQTQPFGISKI